MHQSLSTEDAILQSAEAEFIEKGFSGARTMSIAQAAGVTHSMLHYYYRTKEQLFEKVLVSKLTQMIDCMLIPSGKRYPLCRTYTDASFFEPHGRYYFDIRVFDIGSDFIISNFSGEKTIVIDEIGNLEMMQHRRYYDLLVWLFNQKSLQIILSLRG